MSLSILAWPLQWAGHHLTMGVLTIALASGVCPETGVSLCLLIIYALCAVPVAAVAFALSRIIDGATNLIPRGSGSHLRSRPGAAVFSLCFVAGAAAQGWLTQHEHIRTFEFVWTWLPCFAAVLGMTTYVLLRPATGPPRRG